VAINRVCAHQPNDHVAHTIENLTNRGARQPCSSSVFLCVPLSSSDVYDGQQRLQSIVYFFSGLFGEASSGKKAASFNLTGMDEQSPYFEATYQQLRETNRAAFNKLQNSVLRSFVMKQLDPADDTSIFQVFERLNSGGVVLQGQEIRNCIYAGLFNDTLIKLNRRPSWRQIIGKKTEDKRMRDAELMLRFFALFHNVTRYKKPMKKFLNDFMKVNKRPSVDQVNNFSREFNETSDAIIAYLGEQPFHIHRGLNAAVYDSVFTAFARHLDDLKSTTITDARVKKMKSRFAQLVSDDTYMQWVVSATTDDDVVPKRIDRAEQTLFG
jgi:uncharacterized protein with ParB-like and HNH nuclease domain